MGANELAAKYALRVSATARSAAKRIRATANENEARAKASLEVIHALTDVALPFLQEVKERFEKDSFRLRVSRDQDGELVSVSFRVGRGSIIEIMNHSGIIIVSKIESVKSGNKIRLKIAQITKPRIIKATDINRNNIEKLVETAIADG
jgi:CRP-like cAMP-binding protein